MDCKVFPSPMSVIAVEIRVQLHTHQKGLTVTENAVKLVFRQEGEPVDSILLVLAQFGFDLHRKYVLFNFATI